MLRSSQMQRVKEPSDTAVSPHTAWSSSSFRTSFCRLRSRNKRARKAFGSIVNGSPAFESENSPSRTSTSSKRKTRDLLAIKSIKILGGDPLSGEYCQCTAASCQQLSNDRGRDY